MDNIQELVNRIKDKQPKSILLQLPEGLKKSATAIAEAIEKEGMSVAISADPCYGACDLPQANAAGIELIVHVGHNKFYKDIKTEVPVLYYPWELDVAAGSIDFSVIQEKSIGLIAPVQHLGMIKQIAEVMKKAGKEPVEGGQILGCWTENADRIKDQVDAFMFIGSGTFHATALRGKKVYMLDLEKGKIETIDNSVMEKKRFANIYKCKDAKSFGILVSTKPGQFSMDKAKSIKDMLEKKDKKAFILIMNEISKDKLLGIDVDAFINTACPRLAEEQFSKPFINAGDIKEVL